VNSFICICNPVKVWDFEAFFSNSPLEGYWVFPKATFHTVGVGDQLFLRITTAHNLPGVYGKFTVKNRRTGVVPEGFWRETSHPAGLQFIVDFSVDYYFPSWRISPENLKMAGIPPNSKLLRVPQSKAVQIPQADAQILVTLIEKRISGKFGPYV
jgi:hypothetical protein